jgi:hypothetical protein
MDTVPKKHNFAARVRIMQMRNEGIVDAATAERLFAALGDAVELPASSSPESFLARQVWVSLAFCGGIAVTLLAQGIFGQG